MQPTLAHRAAAPANVGPAGLRTFFQIMDKWGVEAEQARRLLAVPGSTFYRWRKDPSKASVGADTLERISYVLGIYKALHIIYPVDVIADGWPTRPNDNTLFAGRPPLERMLAGNVADLYVVRQHLDARRAAWA